MQNNAFQPFGPTYIVAPGQTVQAVTLNNQKATSYRVRNSSAGLNYITWYPAIQGSAPPSVVSVVPATGSPALNTIGMIGNSVEVFVLPSDAWFTSSAASLEVTPGEGF